MTAIAVASTAAAEGVRVRGSGFQGRGVAALRLPWERRQRGRVQVSLSTCPSAKVTYNHR
eukprot:219096-Chlamydomonas_euryale.AAC.1